MTLGFCLGRKGLTYEVMLLGMGAEWEEDLKITEACFFFFCFLSFCQVINFSKDG